MASIAPPTFDEWVDYCFTQGNEDSRRERSIDDDVSEDRETRFRMDPVTLAQFMTRLFQSPAFIADRCTDEQLADGTSFVFGLGSGYFHHALSDAVPPDAKIRCLHSVTTMYTNLYERVCGCHGSDPDTDLTDIESLDLAVYRIWGDMSSIAGAVSASHLVEHGLAVLKAILDTCTASTCLKSALHGLGHLHFRHEQRVRVIIDSFFYGKGSSSPDWLRSYARNARRGDVD